MEEDKELILTQNHRMCLIIQIITGGKLILKLNLLNKNRTESPGEQLCCRGSFWSLVKLQ
jgi:hypothetical protein